MGQKLEWFVVGKRPADPLSYYDSPQHPKVAGLISNKYCPSKKSGIYACISSRITTVIHVNSITM